MKRAKPEVSTILPQQFTQMYRNAPEFAETQAGRRYHFIAYPGATVKRDLEAELTHKLELCIQRIDKLTGAVEKLVAQLSEQKEKLVEGNNGARRHLAVRKATEEIRALFKEKKVLYYSDIVEELNLDLETVIKACRKLERDGVLEAAELSG